MYEDNNNIIDGQTESENTEYSYRPVVEDNGGQQSRAAYHAPENHQENHPKHRRKQSAAKGLCAVVLAFCCGVAAAGGVQLVQAISGKSSSGTTLQTGSRGTQTVETVSVDTSTELSAADLYDTYVNSTVGITTTVTTNYFGYVTESAASGSGFILTQDGYILTCYHVVEDSQEITVTTYGGDSYEATMVGYDESNDIAVLKVEATGLTPVVLGSSDELRVGDDVAAIGNPLGELTFSLTKGTVSAKDRQITMSSGVTMNLIQTDCAINSGNSGGALFNMYGEVVGITNAKYSSSSSSSSASIDNIGFAIPISNVLNTIQSIMEDGTITKSYIGVSVTSTSTSMTRYGYPSGALIAEVTSGGPAETAGIQQYDIITSVDGKEISSASELSAVVRAASKGDVLKVTVYRSGQTLELSVTVDEQKTSALGEDTTTDSSSSQQSGQNSPFGGYGGYGGFGGNGGSGSSGSSSSDGQSL